jgi:hypothetical protein
MRRFADGLHAIALTLWIGGLWAVGLLVAPTLFYAMNDRILAGSIAGRLFTLVAYIGIGCAAYLLLFRLARFGAAALKHGRFWIVLVMLVLILIGEFGVQPVLAAIRNQALPAEVMESMLRDRFATWHGIASVLYLIECVLGVLLVWLQGRDPS